jgi:hypothetical protein
VVVCFAVDCCTCQGKVLPSLPLRFLPSSSMQMHRQIVLDGFSKKINKKIVLDGFRFQNFQFQILSVGV